MPDDDDYDSGWEDLLDSDEFGDWVIDGDAYDPELDGTAFHDQLLDDFDEHGEEPWDAPSSRVFTLARYSGRPEPTPLDGALQFGPKPPARNDTPFDPDVWHLTHAANLPLIFSSGSISPSSACPWGVRPGDPDIVGRRAGRPTELGPTVGDCVPFHFTVATPFSYRVLAPGWPARLIDESGTQIIRTQPQDYVFLRSTVRRIVVDGADDWVVTNGNAATRETKAQCSLEDLHCVDWSAVASRWSSANQAARQAELLVARPVDLGALISIHCATAEMAQHVRGIAPEWAHLARTVQ